MTNQAALLAGITALAAASAEALLAGGDVTKRLRELRQASHSPPLGVWVLIGFFYYATCFAVLFTLLVTPVARTWRGTAIVGVIALMMMNATWSLLFFRMRDFRLTRRLTKMYAGYVLVLVFVLFSVGPMAGWLFAPYALYLVYGTWWTLAVLDLNE